MSEPTNRRIVLAARPDGAPRDSDFRLEERARERPGEGEMLLRTVYLSLDPYMRGRMNAVKSYAPAVEVGETMVGATVCEVEESRNARFAPGDLVLAYTGWQEWAVSNGEGVRKLDPEAAPVTTALGVLGMPGLTAYVGMLDIGRPQLGDTVVVSAAAGAVGSVAGQIAKLRGCRVVGVAGAEEKCRYVVDELGFDACASHRDPELAARLAAACPEGVDVYYDNVGGRVLEAVVPLLEVGARVPVCGGIAHYNDPDPLPGPDRLPKFMRAVLTRRITVQGFIILDHGHRLKAFIGDMSRWLREGAIKYREDVVEGLENAPRAFRGLLEGRNFGKMIVKIGADPTGGKE